MENLARNLPDAQVLAGAPPPGASSPSPRRGLRPVLPRSVLACQARAWSLHLIRKTHIGRARPDRLLLRYQCRSWRHAGACRRWRASVDYSRIMEALSREEPTSVTFLVLTLKDRSGEPEAAYAILWRKWQSLRQAINRHWGTKIDYVATVEAHRDGWPHLNIILVDKAVAADVGDAHSRAIRWMKVHALHTGWGYMVTWERARDVGAVAHYVLKSVPGGLERLGKEVTKVSQIPVNAPPRFRRLRASTRVDEYGKRRGFLPPRHTGTGEWTGGLLKMETEEATRVFNAIDRWKDRQEIYGKRGPPLDAGALRDLENPAHRPRGPPGSRLTWPPGELRRWFLLRAQAGVTVVPRFRVRFAPFAPLHALAGGVSAPGARVACGAVVGGAGDQFPRRGEGCEQDASTADEHEQVRFLFDPPGGLY